MRKKSCGLQTKILSVLLCLVFALSLFSGIAPKREVNAKFDDLSKSESYVPNGEVALNYQTLQLPLDLTYEFPLYLTTGYYTEPSASGKITWESSDETVVTVNAEGRLKPKKQGQAVVSGTHRDFPTKKATCEVSVYEIKAAGRVLYVSTSGADSNDGTEAHPFLSIQAARDYIRTLRPLPEGGVKVIIEDGTYTQEQTLVFTPEDSGE